VAFYVVPSEKGHPQLEVVEVAFCEVDHCATVNTDQVMVALRGGCGYVGRGAAPSVDLADKAEMKEDVQSAVDGGQTDAGVQFMALLIYVSSGEMVGAVDNYVQHSFALWRQLIAAVLEC